jgi:hypothetical protein
MIVWLLPCIARRKPPESCKPPEAILGFWLMGLVSFHAHQVSAEGLSMKVT